MQGIAKGILGAILGSVGILLFVNLIFFFPWYMTLVTETFQLSQAAASDNYVKQAYYDDTLARLKDRPIFRDKRDSVLIDVENASGFTAVGDDDESAYASLTELQKPYRQRGQPVKVTIRADYPLSVTLWGRRLEQALPVSFSMTTVGLKHYKDLEMDFSY
ncbi:hypothetical protein MO973_10290 [Paenibacillus sp. TRM 82003]|nr:hypothetical protein [Paenibacillus sp. TRM 82003]